jgi:acetylornithine/succinyldiaminopimelate/putrescine aminotransferase
MSEEVASEYVLGTYGNTMTANPRSLDIGSVVLENLSDELTKNVSTKGPELLSKLTDLMNGELKGLITHVQGTGLLISANLREDIEVIGHDAVEQRMRRSGVNVIHGGKNSLRYTPWFWLSTEEIDLICEKTKEAILSMT